MNVYELLGSLSSLSEPDTPSSLGLYACML